MIVFGPFHPVEFLAPAPLVHADRLAHVSGGDVGGAVRLNFVRMTSGMRLHYAEQGPSDGPAVIMLHGFTDSWFSFSRVLPLLPKDLRVIALDQRGHGRSDRPASGYAMDDFAGDAIELMDALKIDRAVIVGHSMGSFVARRVAHLAPGRVRGLVLVGAGKHAQNAVTRELQKAVAELGDPVKLEFVREFQESTVAAPVPDDFMRRIITESQMVPSDVWKRALAGQLAYDTLTTTIKVPTTIIGGDRDSVYSRKEQEALARHIPGASIYVAPGIGHTPHWETPYDFAERLTRFVRP